MTLLFAAGAAARCRAVLIVGVVLDKAVLVVVLLVRVVVLVVLVVVVVAVLIFAAVVRLAFLLALTVVDLFALGHGNRHDVGLFAYVEDQVDTRHLVVVVLQATTTGSADAAGAADATATAACDQTSGDELLSVGARQVLDDEVGDAQAVVALGSGAYLGQRYGLGVGLLVGQKPGECAVALERILLEQYLLDVVFAGARQRIPMLLLLHVEHYNRAVRVRVGVVDVVHVGGGGGVLVAGQYEVAEGALVELGEIVAAQVDEVDVEGAVEGLGSDDFDARVQQAQLADVVGAMEGVRLDLLHVRAGEEQALAEGEAAEGVLHQHLGRYALEEELIDERRRDERVALDVLDGRHALLHRQQQVAHVAQAVECVTLDFLHNTHTHTHAHK